MVLKEGVYLCRIILPIKNTTGRLRNSFQRMSKKKKMLLLVLLPLLCIVIIPAALFTYQIKTRIDQMIIPDTVFKELRFELDTETDTSTSAEPYDQPVMQIESSPTSKVKSSDDRYLLLMGLDYREGHDALLTDTLMVMHIIPQESVIKLLSIPRDLMVTNRSGNKVKINSLFYEGYKLTQQIAAYKPSILTGDIVRVGRWDMDKAILGGAMANTRSKIESILNVHIDHMILANFDSVVSLVDAVGGIEVNVTRSMELSDVGLFLEPGLRTLDGNEALGYVRYRLDTRGSKYYISDFERVKNQQEIIKALARKILSWNSATKALAILDIIVDNIKTDLNYSAMYSMIKRFYGIFHPDSFVSIPFPEYYVPGGFVTIPDDELDELRAQFQDLSS